MSEDAERATDIAYKLFEEREVLRARVQELEGERDRLREALEDIALLKVKHPTDADEAAEMFRSAWHACRNAARAALSTEEKADG